MIVIKASNVIHCADEEGNWFLKSVPQEYTSENTSINKTKLPAVYNLIKLKPGSLVIDFGGGKWDTAVEHFAKEDITILVYDPYNRSAEHNKEVLRILREDGGADAAVCSNVLNVIKEPEARLAVLENIKRLTKPNAPVYITVYEGSGKGNEGPTKSGYQLNRKTSDYLDEISQVFSNVSRKGKLITAINSSTVLASDNDVGYTDYSDPRLQPDEYDPEELHEIDEILLTLDRVDIVVDPYGDWFYKDDRCPWARNTQNSEGNWYSSRYGVFIGDPDDIVEDFDSIIESYIPVDAGTYELSCKCDLLYEIENIESITTYESGEDGSLDSYEDIYTDNAKVYLNHNQSYVYDVDITNVE